jgi:hypothetical protein
MASTFSHVLDDDISETCFLYFVQGTVQFIDDPRDEMEVHPNGIFAVHLDPSEVTKLRDALNKIIESKE